MTSMREESVKEYLEKIHTKEEYHDLFLNMDITMHYLHDNGYGILEKRNNSGYPEFDTSRIHIITENNRQNILFQDIDVIDPAYQKEVVHANIYSLAYLAVKTYANFKELNHKFLKENFNEFVAFLPEEDIAYYRGIIQNGANVYYYAYEKERAKKQLQQDGVSITGQGQGKSQTLIKATDVGRFYSDIEDSNMGAFIQLYIFPTIIIALSLLIPIIAWVFAIIERGQ